MALFARRPGQPPPNLAAIIGDNLVPIAGVVLLQWNAANLILLYFAGFLLDIAACALLLWNLDPDTRHEIMGDLPDTPVNRAKLVGGLALALVSVLAAFGFAFGYPVAAIIATEPGLSVGALLADRGFMMALALHVLMAGHGFIHAYRGLAHQVKADPTFQVVAPIKRRWLFVIARWVAVMAVSFMLPIAAVLVAAYCAASIWYELQPLKT